MTSPTRPLLVATLAAASLSLAACGGMSHRDKTTAIGAAAGGVAGSVLTNGSTLGTVGGAVVGGAVGNEVGKRKKDD